MHSTNYKTKFETFHLSDKNPGPSTHSLNNYIKLSFKDGLINDFIGLLHRALQEKLWESVENANQPTTSRPVIKTIKPRTGIVGIERNIQAKQETTDKNISIAFQDLNKLMGMAKEMVNISRNISTKIREKQGDITEDETIRFKSYLMGKCPDIRV